MIAKRSKRKVTILDVATEANVSPATISNVLNNVGSVSDETRQRILQIVKDVGYVPNPRFRLMGRIRAGQSIGTDTFALLVRSVEPSRFMSDPYYARLSWSIEQAAKEPSAI